MLDLVAATAAAGKRSGKPVGVCSESASDSLMAVVLAGLGITSLSMAPAAAPAVRYALAHHTGEQAAAVSRAVLEASSAEEARTAALAAADSASSRRWCSSVQQRTEADTTDHH